MRLGLELLVFVEVSLDKTTPDAFENFAAAVRRAPEVLECHMVAGGFDYLVKTRVADMAAYRRFLGEILLALPGVKETRTYAVMEEVKSDGVAAGLSGSTALDDALGCLRQTRALTLRPVLLAWRAGPSGTALASRCRAHRPDRAHGGADGSTESTHLGASVLALAAAAAGGRRPPVAQTPVRFTPRLALRGAGGAVHGRARQGLLQGRGARRHDRPGRRLARADLAGRAPAPTTWASAT